MPVRGMSKEKRLYADVRKRHFTNENAPAIEARLTKKMLTMNHGQHFLVLETML
jgi:hypothetical protein